MNDLLVSSKEGVAEGALWTRPPLLIPLQEGEGVPYVHPALGKLPQEAFLHLSGSWAHVLERCDADRLKWSTLSPKYYRECPELRWQRDALFRYLAQCLIEKYPGAVMESFYSGSRVINFALGDGAYPKNCDTDIKVFLTGVPVEALYDAIEIARSFIRRILLQHYPKSHKDQLNHWIELYLPSKNIHSIVDPENGICLASIALGKEDDWVFIISTKRMHTVTGKGLLCPVILDENKDNAFLVSLEETPEAALECARLGIIKTAFPQELNGKGPLSFWELLTFGWGVVSPIVNREFTSRIAATATKFLLVGYYNSHRERDYIGSVSLVITGYCDIATAPHLTHDEKKPLIDLLTEVLRDCLNRGEAIIKESSDTLYAIANKIVTHNGSVDFLMAKILFLAGVSPKRRHPIELGSRTASPADVAMISTYHGHSYLLLPRKPVLQKEGITYFPDRCYLAIPGGIKQAWQHLANALSTVEGRSLWDKISSPLSREGVVHIQKMLRDRDYYALIAYLLGEEFDDLAFSSLFREEDLSKEVVSVLLSSLREGVRVIDGSTITERVYVELKLIALYTCFGDKKGITALGMRLVALLGRVFICDSKEQNTLTDTIKLLLDEISDVVPSHFPDFSALDGGLSPAEYVAMYYLACDQCIATAQIPSIHYKTSAKEYPAVVADLTSLLLMKLSSLEALSLFEGIWDNALKLDLDFMLGQCGDSHTLLLLAPRILQSDGSVSQLYAICKQAIRTVADMPKEEACGLFTMLTDKLLQEGSIDSYLLACSLYEASMASKLMKASHYVPLFKSIASRLVNEKEAAIWVSTSILTLCQQVRLRILQQDEEIIHLLTRVCRGLPENAFQELWQAPAAFILLINEKSRHLIQPLYNKSCSLEPFTPKVEANITYAIIDALLSSHDLKDHALAFSLWRSGRGLNHPNQKYLQGIAARFIGWAAKEQQISMEVIGTLCQIADLVSTSDDRIVLSDKLLNQRSMDPESCRYLSKWLRLIHSTGVTPKNKGLFTSCKERFYPIIREERVTSFSIEEKTEWLLIALQEATPSAALFSWVSNVLNEGLLADSLAKNKALFLQLKECVVQATRIGLFRIEHLEKEEIEGLLNIHLFLYDRGEEVLVRIFLDSCDACPSFPESLSFQRADLRQAWVIQWLGSIKTLKQAETLKKQLESLSRHPDLPQEIISGLYSSCVELLMCLSEGKLRSLKGGLRQGTALLVRSIKDKRLMKTTGVQEGVIRLIKLLYASPEEEVVRIGWNITNDPDVQEFLLRSQELLLEGIREYTPLSNRTAEEVYSYIHSQDEGDPSQFIRQLPRYEAFIMASLMLKDSICFMRFFHRILQRSDDCAIPIFYKDYKKNIGLATVFFLISRTLSSGVWKPEQLREARELLLHIYNIQVVKGREVLYRQIGDAFSWGGGFQHGPHPRKDDILEGGKGDLQVALSASASIVYYYALCFEVLYKTAQKMGAGTLSERLPPLRRKLVRYLVIALVRTGEMSEVLEALEIFRQELLPQPSIEQPDDDIIRLIFTAYSRFVPPVGRSLTDEEVKVRLRLQTVLPIVRIDDHGGKSIDFMSWSKASQQEFVHLYLNEQHSCLNYFDVADVSKEKKMLALELISNRWLLLLKTLHHELTPEAKKKCRYLWVTLSQKHWSASLDQKNMLLNGSQLFTYGLTVVKEPQTALDPSMWFDGLCDTVQQHITLNHTPEDVAVGLENNSIYEFWIAFCVEVVGHLKEQHLSTKMIDLLSLSIDRLLQIGCKNTKLLIIMLNFSRGSSSYSSAGWLTSRGSVFLVDNQGSLQRGVGLLKEAIRLILMDAKVEHEGEFYSLQESTNLCGQVVFNMWYVLWNKEIVLYDDLVRCMYITDRLEQVLQYMLARSLIEEPVIALLYGQITGAVIQVYASRAELKDYPVFHRWVYSSLFEWDCGKNSNFYKEELEKILRGRV